MIKDWFSYVQILNLTLFKLTTLGLVRLSEHINMSVVISKICGQNFDVAKTATDAL